MCGLVGYVGWRDAAEVLLAGLRRLEYRGYDSAGVALADEESEIGLRVLKKAGNIDDGLEKLLKNGSSNGSHLGIGHTRWATHGEPNDRNAHPHTDCPDELALVHNGIIENHQSLRKWLSGLGHEFTSDVDTEVICHLMEHYLQDEGDLSQALARSCEHLEGAYAVAVVQSPLGANEREIVAARKDSPLVVGLGDDENFLASDVPAILPYTRRVMYLENGDFVRLTADDVTVFRSDGRRVDRPVTEVQWDPVQAQRDGYPHFMLKEIEEQPAAWESALRGRLSGGEVDLQGLQFPALEDIEHIYFVACGTSYHAGMAAAPLWERLLQIPASAEIGSEFRYRQPLLGEDTLVVFISQSGETADTLASLDLAIEENCPTICVTNVVGSSMARRADNVIYTQAGPEISVASTKTYTTQLLILFLLACHLGRQLPHGQQHSETCDRLLAAMPSLSDLERQLLNDTTEIGSAAERIADWEDSFFIGRGLDYVSALEGQLKLKEISYIHAEAYPAGELKHGTMALIEEGVPVVAISTQPQLRDKMASNVEEVRARGAWVVAVTDQPEGEVARRSDAVIPVPDSEPELSPLFVGTALQVLAYRAAVLRDCPIDKPRNLAKSVTVE